MDTVVTHGFAFLVGVATGAAGQYLADKYTDKRRRQEATHDARTAFEAVSEAMPNLIGEMRYDLRKQGNELVREFYVLRAKGAVLYTETVASLVYFETEHPNLRHQVVVLENHGFVSNVTLTNVPKYRMSELFVALLRER